jgi:hypothetical protein
MLSQKVDRFLTVGTENLEATSSRTSPTFATESLDEVGRRDQEGARNFAARWVDHRETTIRFENRSFSSDFFKTEAIGFSGAGTTIDFHPRLDESQRLPNLTIRRDQLLTERTGDSGRSYFDGGAEPTRCHIRCILVDTICDESGLTAEKTSDQVGPGAVLPVIQAAAKLFAGISPDAPECLGWDEGKAIGISDDEPIHVTWAAHPRADMPIRLHRQANAKSLRQGPKAAHHQASQNSAVSTASSKAVR